MPTHVYDSSDVPSFWEGWDDRRLLSDEFSRGLVPEVAPAELRTGHVASAVLAVAEDHEADLVVVEWKQHLGSDRARVVCDLLARSPIPVLLLPAPEGDE